MWNKEQVQRIFRNHKLHVLVTGVSSLVCGAASGYSIAKQRLAKEYAELAETEIAQAKTFYAKMRKEGELSTPASAVEALIDEDTRNEMAIADVAQMAEKLQYSNISAKATDVPDKIDDPRTIIPSQESVIKNIFVNSSPINEDGWDYEAEQDMRSPDRPYIISHDEYFEGGLDYTQITLTYFEGDDVLLDEREQPIEDSEATVGDDNLLKFGHGSKDSNIVYVRNETLELDFEIVHSGGKYTEEVLGFIEHSDHRAKIRKFRGDDE